MKRDTAHGFALALAVGVGFVTVLAPNILAENTFLANFVTHEIMAFLIVVLTITMASVANIHLSISRLTMAVKDPAKRREIEDTAAKPLRADIESSARLLFWAFAVCAVALIVKGQFGANIYVTSAVHGVGIVVTAVNVLVLLDIYKTVCTLASNPAAAGGTEDGRHG